MSQISRSRDIRNTLRRLFPELRQAKDDLTLLLDDAQNAPPEGRADGSIGALQYGQLRNIEHALREFLISTLFDTKDPR